jgi:DNA-binding NarL/FixJ family response regulator
VRIFIFGENGFTNLTLANSLSMLGLDVIGEVDNDVVALNQITHHCPDVAVLIMEFGHVKAYELAKTLRKRFPSMGIVIAAKSDDLRFYEIDPKSMPKGILIVRVSKHSDLDHLRDAILLAPHQIDIKSKDHRYTKLSDEQVKTLLLMCHGKANSEIAKMRYVSEKSVEQMLARTAITLGVDYDRKQNQRVRLTNTVYELVNGER